MIDLLDQSSAQQKITADDTGELFTSWDWISVVTDTYAIPIHAVVNRANGAMLAFGVLDDLAGQRLIALPFSDYVLLPYPFEAVKTLADKALEAFPTFSMSIRLAAAAPAEHGTWDIKQSAVYHRLAPAPENELWESLTQSFRNQVRQAQRNKITTRIDHSIEAVDRFYSLHTSVRNRKFNSIPQPRRFFHLIHQRLFGPARGFILEAWHDDVLVAGCLVLRRGQQLYYKFSASLPEALPIRANNLMLWELIRTAGGNGLALDLGRSGLGDGYAGLRHFKDSLGAASLPLLNMTHRPREPDTRAIERAAEFSALAGKTSRLLSSAGLDEDGNDAAAELLYRYFA